MLYAAAAAGILLVVSLAVASAAADPVDRNQPRIVELYPDTPEPYHEGEYVVVEFPNRTDTTGWKLRDRYREVALPNETLDGRVYFGRKGAPRNHSIGTLRLAATGDRISLESPDGAVDVVSYGEDDDTAPVPRERELLVSTEDGWRIRHVDATGFDYRVYSVEAVETYVTPDSGEAAHAALSNAEDSVYVAGFRFDSHAAADALEHALGSGASVEILLEGGPPGGFAADSAEVVDDLTSAGAEARVYRGGGRPYRFMHAKYAVVDEDLAVVSSENWHDGSVGGDGRGTRGWGVVVEDEDVARHLKQLFEADSEVEAAHSWRDVGFEIHESTDFSGTPPSTEVDSERHDSLEVGVFTAPESAEAEITRLLREAEDRVYVQQAYVRSWSDDGNPFVDALVEAARDDVDVKLQMDSRWYVEDGNREMKQRLNEKARRENLSLEVRLSQVAVHNKGFVVDGERAVVSSVNWNENSVTRNREVAVVLRDEDAAAYYERVFLVDWHAEEDDGDVPEMPDYLLQIAVAVLASGAGVWLVVRRTR